MIEIDVTRPLLSRFPVFAAVDIPEVWRYDSRRVSIHRLDKDAGSYRETAESVALPGVTGEVLLCFVEAGITEKRNEWLRNVRAWAQEATRG